MVNKNEILLNIYQDTKNPNSYGSIQGLLQNAQKILPSIKRDDVVSFLKSQKAYTLHRVTNKRFLRRRVLAPKPSIIASCDLADLTSLARYSLMKVTNTFLFLLMYFQDLLNVYPSKEKTLILYMMH